MNRTNRIAALGVAVCMIGAPAAAHSSEPTEHGNMGQEPMGQESMDHGAMKAPEGATEAEAFGVLNAVDADSGTINVTHEPVESLGWPQMTMDLPVTRRVDLTTIEPGQRVRFQLKQGRDKQFRIVDIVPAE